MASAWAQSVTVWLVRKVLRLKMVCPSKTRLIRHGLLILNAGWATLAWALAMLDRASTRLACEAIYIYIYKTQQCLVPQKAGEF